jgi:hypothetical protein
MLGPSYVQCLTLRPKIINGKLYFSRAEAVLHRIAELNPYVQVSSSSAPLDETTDLSFLEKYQVSILY